MTTTPAEVLCRVPAFGAHVDIDASAAVLPAADVPLGYRRADGREEV